MAPASATAQLKILKKIGINSFAELDFPYDEEHHSGEDSSQYSRRRGIECRKMDKFLLSKGFKKIVGRKDYEPITPEDTAPEEETAASSYLSDSDMELETDRSSSATKRPHVSSSGEEAEPNESSNNLTEKRTRPGPASLKNLVREGKEHSASLESAIADLKSEMASLRKQLFEERKEKTEYRDRYHKLLAAQGNGKDTKPTEPKKGPPVEIPNDLKTYIESLLKPILDEIRATKRAPATTGNKATAPTYSQVVGNGPASRHVRTALQNQQPVSEPPTNEWQIAGRLNENKKKKKTTNRPVSTITQGNTRPTNTHDLRAKSGPINKVLLLPTADSPDLLRKLHNTPEAGPSHIKIQRHIRFPSGALLVHCNTAEDAQKLRETAGKIGIEEKRRIMKLPELKIHNIIEDITTEDISDAIVNKYQIAPENISLHNYRSENKTGERFAVITVSHPLYAMMKEARNLLIGWCYCRIDAKIYIRRCDNCGLLGHAETKCRNPAAQPQAGPSTVNEKCADCARYNTQRAEAANKTQIKPILRNEDHSAGSKECRTLRSLIKKSIAIRGAERTRQDGSN